jgi:hypothetical protein
MMSMKAYIKPLGNNRFSLTMPAEREPGPYRGVGTGDIVKYGGSCYRIIRTPQSCYDGKLIYVVDTLKI